jgi:hypothetical protein
MYSTCTFQKSGGTIPHIYRYPCLAAQLLHLSRRTVAVAVAGPFLLNNRNEADYRYSRKEQKEMRVAS